MFGLRWRDGRRRGRHRGPVGASVVAAGLALVAVLGGCGGPDNVYVAHPDAGVFVRLPPDWAVFTIADKDPTADPRSDPSAGTWRVVIDGAVDADRAHIESRSPTEPVGFVEIVPTGLIEGGEQISNHASLRSLLLGGSSDPLDAAGVEVVAYEEIDLGHHWGNRVVAEVQRDGDTVVMSQVAFLDDGSNRLQVMRVLCSADCYEQNEAEITAVLDSWTLEG